MRTLRKLIDAITEPIVDLIVHIGVSREINEDGSWDKYHERRNKRLAKKESKMKKEINQL